MSRGRRHWLAAVCGSLSLSAAQAQPQDASQGDANSVPDLDFLEYLGTWQASDDEWLAVSGWDGNVAPGDRERDDANADEEADEKD